MYDKLWDSNIVVLETLCCNLSFNHQTKDILVNQDTCFLQTPWIKNLLIRTSFGPKGVFNIVNYNIIMFSQQIYSTFPSTLVSIWKKEHTQHNLYIQAKQPTIHEVWNSHIPPSSMHTNFNCIYDVQTIVSRCQLLIHADEIMLAS